MSFKSLIFIVLCCIFIKADLVSSNLMNGANHQNEDCLPVNVKEEEDEEKCKDKSANKITKNIFFALYFAVGAEMVLLILTIAAFITIMIITNKKYIKDLKKRDEANIALLEN